MQTSLREAIHEAELEQCRNDLAAFCRYVMRDENGEPWTNIAPHQQKWFDLLTANHPRTLIVAPRGHAKTTTIVAYILWCIGKNPNLVIKYVCGDDDLAIEKFGLAYLNLTENRYYREVFPHIALSTAGKDEDSKHKLTVQRDAALGLQNPTLQAFSVFATGTGGRGHLIIFDDVADERVTFARSLIPQIKHRIEAAWLKTLYPGGRAIMIGTFWSFDPPDIHVEYSANPRWVLWQQPACYRTADNRLKGPVLWPEVWPLERLEDTRLDSEVAFRQQFLLEGTISARDYFSEDAIQRSLDSGILLGEGDDPAWPVYIGVDPAASLKRKGSFSTIVAIAVRPDGKKVVLAAERLKMAPEGVANNILDMALRFRGRLRLILVENNAYQEALVSLLRVMAESRNIPMEDIPLQGHFTGSNKWSLDTGLPCVAVEMQTGKWIMPFGGDEHQMPGHMCNICAMVKEMRDFPYGETTDLIMGLLLASTAANKMGNVGQLPVVVSRQQRHVTAGV